MKKLLIILGVIVIVLGAAYYWFLVENPAPESRYVVDMVQVRQLASKIPGAKASEIRVEKVATFSWPNAIVAAGDGWGSAQGLVNSYQLVFPQSTLIIDTALSESSSMFELDQAAYDRMSHAMQSSALILITHEHPDHVGGLVAHPQLAKVMANVKFSKEQRENPELGIPKALLESSSPLVYNRYEAVAPGVVVIQAPGHTPGSQMVFVQRADGTEYLFLGDVAWSLRNVEIMRGRPRLVSLLWLGEDRTAVMSQLVELNRLLREEPNLHQVPGHDGLVTEEFLKKSLFVEKFRR